MHVTFAKIMVCGMNFKLVTLVLYFKENLIRKCILKSYKTCLFECDEMRYALNCLEPV